MTGHNVNGFNGLPDLTYVYPFQRERFIEHWSKPLPMRDNLKSITITNGYALPVIRHGKSSRWMGYGGIVDKEGRFVPMSAMHGENGVQSMGLSYSFQKDSCKKLSGEYIYLGFFIKHWGHFIIDSSTRLYFALKNPDLKCFFILREGQNIEPFPHQIDRALELAGLRDRIMFISEPTQIEEIIVPEQSYVSQSHYSQEYIDTFNVIANNIEPTHAKAFSKVFFSRSNFNKYRRCEIGDELLDELFSGEGYEIIYPELESLDNQIFFLNSCKEWSTVAGSLVHNLMFAISPPATKIVSKSSYINLEDMDTCKIKGVLPQYLDFYISRSPTHHYWGPFMFFPNHHMRSYINSNKVADGCNNLLDLDKHKYLFRNYNVRFNELWPNQHVNFEADQNPLAPNYFHPELVLDWSRHYARMEHDSYQTVQTMNNPQKEDPESEG